MILCHPLADSWATGPPAFDHTLACRVGKEGAEWFRGILWMESLFLTKDTASSCAMRDGMLVVAAETGRDGASFANIKHPFHAATRRMTYIGGRSQGQSAANW